MGNFVWSRSLVKELSLSSTLAAHKIDRYQNIIQNDVLYKAKLVNERKKVPAAEIPNNYMSSFQTGLVTLVKFSFLQEHLQEMI